MVLAQHRLHHFLRPGDRPKGLHDGTQGLLLRTRPLLEHLRLHHHPPLGLRHRPGGRGGGLERGAADRHARAAARSPHAAAADLPPPVHEGAQPHGPRAIGWSPDTLLGRRSALLHALCDSHPGDQHHWKGYGECAWHSGGGRALLIRASRLLHILPLLHGRLCNLRGEAYREDPVQLLRTYFRCMLLCQHDLCYLWPLQPHCGYLH
mmetsp:Transcript_23682/g.67719  ORF Transcript_23682/g.67719 Transcript_23682/m.67719 type:complete len:207 (+) Transcript_23682:741-1361(+)